MHVADGNVGIEVASDTACSGGSFLMITKIVIEPAWTLSLEAYFYLLVPVLSMWRNRTVSLVGLASFLLALTIAIFHNKNPWFRSFFPAELYLFLAGFLAFRLRDAFQKSLGYTIAAATVAVIIFYQHLPMFDWFDPAGLNIVLYLAFAASLPSMFATGNSFSFEQTIGDLAYPIYISHVVIESVIYTLQLHSRWSLSLYQWITFNIVMDLIVAVLLLTIASPIERLRQHIKRRRLSFA
jgi:peptidoglycan/LPS O-acetylase OafA/YrhL